MESTKIYVYRYIWQTLSVDENGEDKKITNCKIISGLIPEQDQFSQMLRDNEEVLKATRIYLHEYDVTQIEQYDFIK